MRHPYNCQSVNLFRSGSNIPIELGRFLHMKSKTRPNTARDFQPVIELPEVAEQAQALVVLQALEAQAGVQGQAQE